jgi:hypothetical protein
MMDAPQAFLFVATEEQRHARAPMGQAFWIIPTSPDVTRNAIGFSPSNRTRSGGPSGPTSSDDISAGSQYSRISLPIAVSAISVLSVARSIGLSPVYPLAIPIVVILNEVKNLVLQVELIS